MAKVVYAFLFAFGIVCALLVSRPAEIYSPPLPRPPEKQAPVTAPASGDELTFVADFAQSNPVESTVLPLDDSPRLTQARERQGVVRDSLSSDDRLRILGRALDEGSSDSLQLLRKEYLTVFPDYENTIIPQLKKQGLESLLSRFTPVDWVDWSRSRALGEAGATPARKYIDNVLLVHTELGRYFETAAYILHGMYLSILSGTPYDARRGLGNLLQEADEMFKSRTSPAHSPADFLDIRIVEQEEFMKFVEKIRCELVQQYFSSHPKALEQQLTLVLHVRAEFCSGGVQLAVQNLLKQIGVYGSLALHKDTISKIQNSKTFAYLAVHDAQTKRAIAEFLLLGALDAMDAGDRPGARMLLASSRKVNNGLSLQSAVERHISEEPPEQPSKKADLKKQPPEKVKAEPEFHDKDAGSASKTVEEAGAGTAIWRRLLNWLVSAVVILAVLAVLVLKLRSSIRARRGESTPALLISKAAVSREASGKEGGMEIDAHISITPPSEIQFDEESRDTDDAISETFRYAMNR